MKKLFLLFFLITASLGHAQKGEDNTTYNLKDLDEAPAPEGIAFTDYFKKNFKSAEKPTAPLQISFLVEKGGVVHDAKVFGEVSPAISKEAIRVIKTSKKWKPGKKGGKAVRTRYTATINL